MKCNDFPQSFYCLIITDNPKIQCSLNAEHSGFHFSLTTKIIALKQNTVQGGNEGSK